MAQVCSYCGRPLPENGVCPCRMQRGYQPSQQYQPPQYQQPQGYPQQGNPQPQYNPQQGRPQQYDPQRNAQYPTGYPQGYPQQRRPQRPVSETSLGAGFADLVPFLQRSMKDYGGELRKKVEKNNVLFGVAIVILFVSVMFLGWITRAIGILSGSMFGLFFGKTLTEWLIVVILSVGAALGANALSTLASHQRASFIQILTATLTALIIPTALMVVCIPFNLIDAMNYFTYPLVVMGMLISNYIASTKGLKAESLWTALIHVGLAALTYGVLNLFNIATL